MAGGQSDKKAPPEGMGRAFSINRASSRSNRKGTGIPYGFKE